MKVQEGLVRAIAGKISWFQAAEILGSSVRSPRRWKSNMEEARRGRTDRPSSASAFGEKGPAGGDSACGSVVFGSVFALQHAALSSNCDAGSRSKGLVHTTRFAFRFTALIPGAGSHPGRRRKSGIPNDLPTFKKKGPGIRIRRRSGIGASPPHRPSPESGSLRSQFVISNVVGEESSLASWRKGAPSKRVGLVCGCPHLQESSFYPSGSLLQKRGISHVRQAKSRRRHRPRDPCRWRAAFALGVCPSNSYPVRRHHPHGD
jgi:hypothetical protein